MEEFSNQLFSILRSKLKALRVEKGLNQSELAERITSLGRTSISNFENGKQNLSLPSLYLICRELNVDIHAILPTESEVSDVLQKAKQQNFVEDAPELYGLNKTKRSLQQMQKTINDKTKK